MSETDEERQARGARVIELVKQLRLLDVYQVAGRVWELERKLEAQVCRERDLLDQVEDLKNEIRDIRESL